MALFSHTAKAWFRFILGWRWFGPFPRLIRFMVESRNYFHTSVTYWGRFPQCKRELFCSHCCTSHPTTQKLTVPAENPKASLDQFCTEVRAGRSRPSVIRCPPLPPTSLEGWATFWNSLKQHSIGIWILCYTELVHVQDFRRFYPWNDLQAPHSWS